MTNLFLNQAFEKNRIRLLVLWSLTTFGEYNTLNFIEKLKDIGFYYATFAGLSLGINDLLIPPIKSNMIIETEFSTKKALLENEKGNNTPVERLQQMIDFWHRTSEVLRSQVVQNFNETDKLNPVFMMAFSGARGNISQVRQLVGMRGLMADPDGQILDFPIRSNFREGLTLTEYVISCYGARKGVVDTALKTANSGYLTRRLVDVAHHIIITQFDCQTKKGIFVSHTKINRKIFVSMEKKIIGRTILESIPNIIEKNQLITPSLAIQINKLKNKILVRSPLTCEFKNSICQLCYGWSLSNSQLVSIGECVGIIAAQSIGEPGTQLTMRTFHTGGVFSGDVMEEIRSPEQGIIKYQQSLPGLLIRTLHGKIAYLTKQSSKICLKQKNNIITEFSIPQLTILFVKNFEKVKKNKLLAEYSFFLNLKNKEIQTKYKIFSGNDGEIFFEKVLCLQIKKKEGNFLRIGLNLGSIWLMHSKIQKSQNIRNFFNTGDIVTNKSILGASFLKSNFEGVIQKKNNVPFFFKKNRKFNLKEKILQNKFYFKKTNFFVNKNFIQFFYHQISYRKLGYFFSFKETEKTFFLSLGFNQRKKNIKSFYFQEFFEKNYTQKLFEKKKKNFLFFYPTTTFIFTNLKKRKKIYKNKILKKLVFLNSKKFLNNLLSLKIEKIKKKKFFIEKKRFFFIKKNFFNRKKLNSKNFSFYYLFDNKLYKEKNLIKLTFEFDWFYLTKNNFICYKNFKTDLFVQKKIIKKFFEQMFFSTQIVFIKKNIFLFQEKFFIQNKLLIKNLYFNKNKIKLENFKKNNYFLNNFRIKKKFILSFKKIQQKKLLSKKKFIFNKKNLIELNIRKLNCNKQEKTIEKKVFSKILYKKTNLKKISSFYIIHFFKIQKKNYCTGSFEINKFQNLVFLKRNKLKSIKFSKKILSNKEKILTTKKKYTYEQKILHKNYLFSQHSGEILKITKENFLKKKSLILTKNNLLAFSLKEKNYYIFLGNLIRIGDSITKKKTINSSGQVFEITKKKLILRKADSILFSAQGLIHIKNRECIEQKNLLVTLFYQKLKTEDIIQGIPKIEELFEARQLKKNQNLRENIHGKLFLCMNKYKKKYPLKMAVRKTIKTIQQILITSIQKVYQDQGVTISDKHMEIIIRQMTTKVFILESGTTGLLRGELVDLKLVEIINLGNIFFREKEKIFYFQKAKYEPIIFGITKASLETESFISAASFQETTRILSRSSIEKKIDFLRGLKENVILGRVIPGGTGFTVPKILNSFFF